MNYPSPNPANYTLGKGILYFDQFDSSGQLTGEVDLGNAPELSFNMSVDMLDHFSSRAGISSKDAQVTKLIVPTFTFTLDEFSDETLSMLFYGQSTNVINQAAVPYKTEALPATVNKKSYYSLANRNIGAWAVNVVYETGKTAADIPDDAVLTNTSGGATNTYSALTAVGTRIFLKTPAGTGLAASGDIYIATVKIATYTIAPHFDTTRVLIKKGSAWLLPGVDFTLDSDLGRILIGTDSTLTGSEVVSFGVAASSVRKISAVSSNTLKGKIRFVSNNPEGAQYQMEAWKCSLKPSGDTAFISDNWATVKFTAEVLLDRENHPSSPYLDVTIY
jgi:hypothetical protein